MGNVRSNCEAMARLLAEIFPRPWAADANTLVLSGLPVIRLK